MTKEELLDLVEQLQQDNEKLTKQNMQLERQFNICKIKLDEYEDVIDEAIEYIKHSWRLKFDQIYDTSKCLSGWEVEELLSLLERGKE